MGTREWIMFFLLKLSLLGRWTSFEGVFFIIFVCFRDLWQSRDGGPVGGWGWDAVSQLIAVFVSDFGFLLARVCIKVSCPPPRDATPLVSGEGANKGRDPAQGTGPPPTPLSHRSVTSSHFQPAFQLWTSKYNQPTKFQFNPLSALLNSSLAILPGNLNLPGEGRPLLHCTATYLYQANLGEERSISLLSGLSEPENKTPSKL